MQLLGRAGRREAGRSVSWEGRSWRVWCGAGQQLPEGPNPHTPEFPASADFVLRILLLAPRLISRYQRDVTVHGVGGEMCSHTRATAPGDLQPWALGLVQDARRWGGQCIVSHSRILVSDRLSPFLSWKHFPRGLEEGKTGGLKD